MEAALAPIEGEIISQSLAPINPAEYFKPVVSSAEAVERQKALTELVGTMLIPATVDKWGNVNMDGADYGLIPGTRTRTLFQPGAEKLALFFGLTVTTYCTEKQEIWGPEAKDAFFRYTYKATASFKGQVIRETERTCHTREKKYAWIWVERPAPSKEEQTEMIETQCGRWGTKWLKEGGRNVKTEVWQERRSNPDPWSLQFVVQAMAQKRAKVAVVKEALAATGYFSTEIDVEDFQNEQPARDAVQPKPERRTNEKPTADGADRFWKAVKTSGIQRDNAMSFADRAIKGEISWDDAIAELPEA